MNKINIKPFGSNILVKPTKKKQVVVSDSGTLCEYGEVLAIGDEVQKIKVGDIIGFLIWGINSLQIENEKYYFIGETSDFILGTFKMPGGMAS